MSDNGQTNPSRLHSQSHPAGATTGGDPNIRTVQSETITQLDKVVIEYTVQHILLHTVFESIHTILSENPPLTDEQCAQSLKIYKSRLKQAATAQVQAITQVEHL